MSILWVAYTMWGDLVAEAYSYNYLMYAVDKAGYDEEDVVVEGRSEPRRSRT